MQIPATFPDIPSHLRSRVGQRFGQLVVVGYAGRGCGKFHAWWCSCDCGGAARCIIPNLTRGHSKSCGCGRRVAMSKSFRKHGGSKHADDLPEYRSWCQMRRRCRDPKSIGWKNYGGRGITICSRWIVGEGGMGGFQCFLADMGKKPDRSYTIDRYPNNDGNYEPGNCRWATRDQQNNNTRRQQ